MAQRRHHYERAFEEFLRARRIPYVAVDEARKALLPPSAVCVQQPGDASAPAPDALKSFDFVIYAEPSNLLLDVKGRKVASGSGRLENWVTQDDIESLSRWEQLFGAEFRAAFVFVYWCDAPPPDALFQEIVEYQGCWYALRAVSLSDYAANMKVRSPRWRTADLPARAFERLSQPLSAWAGQPRGTAHPSSTTPTRARRSLQLAT